MKLLLPISSILLLFSVFSLSANASEVQYGSGNMKLEGGLLGLETEISSPVKTFTFQEQHVNLLSSDVFYNYQVRYYTGQSFQSDGGIVSGIIGGDLLLSEADYSLSGIDAQVTLGYDIYKKKRS